MSNILTIQLPDGTTKVQKTLYKTDFNGIKRVLLNISSTKTSRNKSDGSKKTKKTTDS